MAKQAGRKGQEESQEAAQEVAPVKFKGTAAYYRPKAKVLAYELTERVSPEMDAGDFIVPYADESGGEFFSRDDFLSAFELAQTIDDFPEVAAKFGLGAREKH